MKGTPWCFLFFKTGPLGENDFPDRAARPKNRFLYLRLFKEMQFLAAGGVPPMPAALGPLIPRDILNNRGSPFQSLKA